MVLAQNASGTDPTQDNKPSTTRARRRGVKSAEPFMNYRIRHGARSSDYRIALDPIWHRQRVQPHASFVLWAVSKSFGLQLQGPGELVYFSLVALDTRL